MSRSRIGLLCLSALWACRDKPTPAPYRGPPSEARQQDSYRQPERLVAALLLHQGDAVAEVGAGGGYLSLRLARAVGPKGRVVCTDIDGQALASLRGRAAAADLSQVDREARSAAVPDREARSAAVPDREARSAAVPDREARSAAVPDREARSAAVPDREARSAAVPDREARSAAVIETRLVTPSEPGLERAAYDLIFLAQVDHLLPDREAYLRALLPALKPGGRIALSNNARYLPALKTCAQRLPVTIVTEPVSLPNQFLLSLYPTESR